MERILWIDEIMYLSVLFASPQKITCAIIIFSNIIPAKLSHEIFYLMKNTIKRLLSLPKY